MPLTLKQSMVLAWPDRRDSGSTSRLRAAMGRHSLFRLCHNCAGTIRILPELSVGIGFVDIAQGRVWRSVARFLALWSIPWVRVQLPVGVVERNRGGESGGEEQLTRLL